ncbi:MAG: hypothetical protein HY725_19410 [Candidatus Rokubacteria bacterium]|nr:hypothetical protein [Candidatus Rokubacteria bacterium]
MILECDPATLIAQSSSVAARLENIVETFIPKARVFRVGATALASLGLGLARCAEACSRCDVIVIVGHSNISELKLTADDVVTWDALARWLEPLRPTRIVLVACEAGRWLAAGPLFKGIPTLKEVYGSPVLVTERQAAAINALVLYLLSGRRLKVGDLKIAQAVNFLITRGILIRRTRADPRRPAFIESAAWTIGEEALKALLGRLEATIRT